MDVVCSNFNGCHFVLFLSNLKICASPFIVVIEMDNPRFCQRNIKDKLTKIISCVLSCKTLWI